MSTSVQGIPSVDAIVKKLAATENHVAEAMRSAIRKTTVWAGNQGRSGIASRLNISLRAMKGRVGIFIRPEEGFSKSWFGLNPLSSSRLRPRQTSTGATMDGMKGEVKHAFVRSKNGSKYAFIRLPERNTSGPRKGKQKLDVVRLPINDVSQEVIANDVYPKIEQRFLMEFERELNWRVSKS